jgi:hypothetical protein
MNKNKLQSESEDKDSQQERLRRLYEFLLSKTDLGLDPNSSARKAKSKNSQDVTFNETLISHQWGMNNYRLFIRRMLRSMYPNDYLHEQDKKSSAETIPSIDLDQLTIILESLDRYCSTDRDEKYQKGDRWNGVQQRFTQSDKLTALRLYGELSESERKRLNLPMSSTDKILARLIDRLNDPSLKISEDLLREIYRSTLYRSLCTESKSFSQERQQREQEIQDLVKKEVEEIFKHRLYSNDSEDLDKKIEEYIGKVFRQLDRIRFHSGSQQVSEFLDPRISEDWIENISPNLILRLTHSVVKNELLFEQFPIFIKYINVTRFRPLPLWIQRDTDNDGLLDKNLIENKDENKHQTIEIAALERQYAYRVRVYFQVSTTDDGKKIEIDSYQDATGIGSPISLVMAAINRILLWDIPCLKDRDIYPIAKQLFLHDDITDNGVNSPVWSHSVVQLCTKKTIDKALEEESSNYNLLNVLGGSATGDFYGFDLLETVARSGFNARINAIKQLGIDPDIYIKNVVEKVKEVKALRKAKKLLSSYPFSFLAMRGSLEKELFLINDEGFSYRKMDKKTYECLEKNAGKHWSLVAYDAHLNIAESLLTEGKYVTAKYYLDVIELHLDNLSESVRAKYHYLMAQHHYLYDLRKSESDKLPKDYVPIHPDRYLAIQKVQSELKEAKRFLQKKVEACMIIDELSQNNVYPFFSLLGKIHFLEARVCLNFGGYLDANMSRDRKIKLVLINLQKARVYAARNGDFDDYSCYTAFQSWIYSMIAYLDKKDFRGELSHLDRTKCLDWSKRLLKHAFICYERTGESSYHVIKYNAGNNYNIDNKGYELFGSTKIKSIPFVQEVQGKSPGGGDSINEIIKIPYFETLKLNEKEIKQFSLDAQNDEDTTKYLFGTRSCVMLFALGMYKIAMIDVSDNYKTTIDEALRCLIASWAVAKDGGHKENDDVIERNTKAAYFDRFGISVIRAIYPHRTSYVVQLSSVAIILAEILFILYSYPANNQTTNYKEKIDKQSDESVIELSWENNLKNSSSKLIEMRDELLCDFYEEKEVDKSETNYYQDRFHGHMDNQLTKIAGYYHKIIEQIEAGTWNQDKFKNLGKSPEEIIKNKLNVCNDLKSQLINDLFCLILGEM